MDMPPDWNRFLCEGEQMSRKRYQTSAVRSDQESVAVHLSFDGEPILPLEPKALRGRVFWDADFDLHHLRVLKTCSLLIVSIVPGSRHSEQEDRAHHTHLLEALEQSMADADAMVQEPMNWCAAQIGIADAGLRGWCIQLGERLRLYKDYPVSKGCTSPYLPIWIESVVGKQAPGIG